MNQFTVFDFFVDEPLQVVSSISELITIQNIVFLISNQQDNLKLRQCNKFIHQFIALFIQLSFVLECNDLLVSHYSFICWCDNCNQEIEHDNDHEECLNEPDHPNHVDVQGLGDRIFFA